MLSLNDNLRSILLSSVIASLAILCPQPASAQTTSGQEITDGSGNVFMEEIVDEKKARQEEERRKQANSINRRRLSPEELNNVGIQMSPSGGLVPLINRNAPPERRNRSQLTVETQPAWTMMPYYPYYNPYMGYNNPYQFQPRSSGYPTRYPGLPGIPGISGIPGFPGIAGYQPYTSYGAYPGNVQYSIVRPYQSRPNLYLGAGSLGIASKTTITYGDSPSPQVSNTFTLPPGGLGSPLLNQYNSGGLYGGIRTPNSFGNIYLPGQTTYSFDSTIKPLLIE